MKNLTEQKMVEPIRSNFSSDRPITNNDLIRPFVEYECRARLVRLQMFKTDVINDSAWSLLQELFIAHLDGDFVGATELHQLTGLPETTVLRYLKHLEKLNLIRRGEDSANQRSDMAYLTHTAALWMREYFSKMIWGERRLLDIGDGIFSTADGIQEIA